MSALPLSQSDADDGSPPAPADGADDARALPSFAALGLPADLLSAVEALGFTTPTYIQAAAIPPLLQGRDITGIAQTGTGKTAAFALPLLAAVDAAADDVQALVLTPTRELTIQVAEAIETFAAHSRGVSVVPIYGGASIEQQRRGLQRGAQVVVGTPGRVIDLIDRGVLRLGGVRYVVLDEADEMLRMGFAEDVDQILGNVPASRQVALFSATMPASIRSVARAHLTDPVDVVASRQASTVTTVEQQYAVVPFKHKIGALARVLATTDAEATIVFVRTRGTAEDVGSGLVERGLKAATISGEVPQRERERIVERLRSGALDVLVATDVAARGLDVERVGLVVNFDLPTESEVYVHRIGRTGRAGRSGRALSFVTPREVGRLRAIERLTRAPLTEAAVPSPADVSAHRARVAVASVPGRQERGRLEPYREAVAGYLAEHHTDPVELAAVLLALAVGDPGAQGRTEDEETEADHRRATRADGPSSRRAEHDPTRPPSRRRVTGGQRYRLAVGHTHGARPEAIVGAITGEGGLRGDEVGKIDIFPSFSLVELGPDLSADAVRRIGAARVAGRPLRIRPDQGPPGADQRGRPAR